MDTTVKDFHDYMNQLYNIAVQNGRQHIIVNTGSSPIAPQQIWPHWKTPGGEEFTATFVGNYGSDLVYVVSW